MLDRILQIAENRVMQISAMHIPGKNNQVADSISRLAMSGDFQIRQEVLVDALQRLKMKPSLDVFANRRNRQCKRFYSLMPDSWLKGQDGLSKCWIGEISLLHPPILFIWRTINKIMGKKIKGMIIVPSWTSQSWWPDLQKLIVKMIVLGNCKQNLII
ncbi:MAG: hypothetical protein EZS28_046829 [Streblomastix strix]|uniref:RNase H type-1 domain-containing protein n=1 Tax=Streblomastix strix TaxID=222440 RepID=A0A5J4TH12_9EUKA|nr:MAG: hypothetical protein EZS28_046829 [Streblomastix strix]